MSRLPARRPGRLLHGRLRSAFTLVEMLIAMALTLIMVIAIAQFYAFLGETVRDGRALIETGAQVRAAVQLLKTDLDQVTVPVTPWADGAAAMGYFTIAEGRGNDYDWDLDGNNDATNLTHLSQSVTTLLGDVDDYVGFTARAKGEPWVGQTIQVNLATGAPLNVPPGTFNGEYNIEVATSHVAEIAWWTSFTDIDGDYLWDFAEPRFVHRRVLLIRPDWNQLHPQDPNGMANTPYFVRLPAQDLAQAQEQYYTLMQSCDVSVRLLPPIRNNFAYFVANSLSDLTRREHRFMHLSGDFPNRLDLNPHKFGNPNQPRVFADVNNYAGDNRHALYRWNLAGDRRGDDVVLANVLAFDVRVYDPTAPLMPDNSNGAVLQPGDVGFNAVSNNPPVGYGAFVDLYYTRYAPYAAGSHFSDVMAPKSQLATTANTAALAYYDTWAQDYERDGLNQNSTLAPPNGDTIADGATNGIDDNSTNGVDDPAERDTDPPYPHRLRGIEVKIRVYEPGTRQMRQATVGADFLPE